MTRDMRMFGSSANETTGKARNVTDVAIMQHIKNFHSFPILITRQDNSRMLIINQEGEIIPRVIRIEIEGQDNLLDTLAEMEEERWEFAKIAKANQIGPHISESEDPVDAYTETAEDTNALDCVPSAWCYQDESGNQPVEPTSQNLCQLEKSECTETLQIGNTFNCSRWPKEKSELYKQYGNSGIVPTPQMRRKEFPRHVINNHPECGTIHLSPKNKMHGALSNINKELWLDPEGRTWWESEEELEEARKKRSTLEIFNVNEVQIIDQSTTSTLPVAKMRLVEGEESGKQKDKTGHCLLKGKLVQCLLCTRIWQGTTGGKTKNRIQSHVRDYHTVPIVIQHSNIKRGGGEYLKICKRSADGIEFTYSDIEIKERQVSLTNEIEPPKNLDELSQDEISDLHITDSEGTNDTDHRLRTHHQGDSGCTNSENQERDQLKQTLNTTDCSQNKPSEAYS